MTVDNPRLTRATALDPNGYPAGEVHVGKSADKIQFSLPKDAMYLILQGP
jgi:hypothetical protein